LNLYFFSYEDLLLVCVFLALFYSTTARYLNFDDDDDNIFEKRGKGRGGGGGKLEAAQFVIEFGQALANLITDLKKGNKNKADFTKQFVDAARKKYPAWSVAIVHEAKTSGHAIHQHEELNTAGGTSFGYEIYFAKPGKRFDIWRQGDGGPINWGFAGAWHRGTGKDNDHIWLQ
jgi:hypothetical protein